MRTFCTTRRFLLLVSLICSGAAARAQDVVLVANPGLHINSISAADVRDTFLGTKTKFADGSHAIPVILKGGPVHEVFLRNHLGESPEEFRAQWRKLIFTGQGAMPRAFDSEAALIEYVAATPGAIGYVSHASPQDRVKCIPIR
jgi:ABC-type phosphate transport system substrate-binding protein